MKVRNIYIGKYDWVVRVYIDFTDKYMDEVLSVLSAIRCSKHDLADAKYNLEDSCNSGITFSNYNEGMSVMVIGRTSSAREFLDSLVHEIMHLAVHISESKGINLSSEEPCYLAGDFARLLYPLCKDKLCCRCCH